MVNKKDVVIGFVIFFVNLSWAVYQQYSVTDLLWGLWISSLTMGFGYMLISIFTSNWNLDDIPMLKEEGRRMDVFGPGIAFNLLLFLVTFFSTGLSLYSLIMLIILAGSVIISLDRKTRNKLHLGFVPNLPPGIILLLITLPMSLFMLAFFTVHFGGFHLAHSMILNEYYPLVVNTTNDGGFDGFVEYVRNILKVTISRYWVFIGFSAFSRFKLYDRSVRSNRGGSLFMPYVNVIRMHFTIFLIVALNVANAGQYLLYAVFIIYFLPVADLFRLLFGKKVKAVAKKGEDLPRRMGEYVLQTFRKKIKG